MINLLIFLVLSHQCQENKVTVDSSRLWEIQQNRARFNRHLNRYIDSTLNKQIEHIYSSRSTLNDIDFHQQFDKHNRYFNLSTMYTPLHNTFGVILCDKYTKKVDCEKCWDGQDEYFCSRCKKAYHTKYDTKTIYIYTDWIYGNNSIFTSWTKNVDTLAF